MGKNLQKKLEPPIRLGEHDFPKLELPNLGWHYDSDSSQLKISYGDHTISFFVVYRPDWTERNFKNLRDEIANSQPGQSIAVLPYLNERQLQTLALEGTSGMDLCGNAFITTRDAHHADLLLLITGRPNRFRIEQRLKNPYSGKASLVGRTLLRQSVFRRLEDLAQAIEKRGEQLSLAQISRTVKQLREDLILEVHSSGRTYLLQPDALLDRLLPAWVNAAKKPRVLWRGRVQGSTTNFLPDIFQNAKKHKARAIMTGLGSAAHHTNISMEDIAYVYADVAEPLLEKLKAQATERFVNLEIRHSPDDAVYFDPDKTDPPGINWASAVQTYLEMMQTGDIRLRDSAQPLRQRLINNVLSDREIAL